MRIVESAAAGSLLPSVAPGPSPAHEHDWRQCAVLYEDGYATEEYGCAGCGGVTFR